MPSGGATVCDPWWRVADVAELVAEYHSDPANGDSTADHDFTLLELRAASRACAQAVAAVTYRRYAVEGAGLACSSVCELGDEHEIEVCRDSREPCDATTFDGVALVARVVLPSDALPRALLATVCDEWLVLPGAKPTACLVVDCRCACRWQPASRRTVRVLESLWSAGRFNEVRRLIVRGVAFSTTRALVCPETHGSRAAASRVSELGVHMHPAEGENPVRVDLAAFTRLQRFVVASRGAAVSGMALDDGVISLPQSLQAVHARLCRRVTPPVMVALAELPHLQRASFTDVVAMNVDEAVGAVTRFVEARVNAEGDGRTSAALQLLRYDVRSFHGRSTLARRTSHASVDSQRRAVADGVASAVGAARTSLALRVLDLPIRSSDADDNGPIVTPTSRVVAIPSFAAGTDVLRFAGSHLHSLAVNHVRDPDAFADAIAPLAGTLRHLNAMDLDADAAGQRAFIDRITQLHGPVLKALDVRWDEAQLTNTDLVEFVHRCPLLEELPPMDMLSEDAHERLIAAAGEAAAAGTHWRSLTRIVMTARPTCAADVSDGCIALLRSSCATLVEVNALISSHVVDSHGDPLTDAPLTRAIAEFFARGESVFPRLEAVDLCMYGVDIDSSLRNRYYAALAATAPALKPERRCCTCSAHR